MESFWTTPASELFAGLGSDSAWGFEPSNVLSPEFSLGSSSLNEASPVHIGLGIEGAASAAAAQWTGVGSSLWGSLGTAGEWLAHSAKVAMGPGGSVALGLLWPSSTASPAQDEYPGMDVPAYSGPGAEQNAMGHYGGSSNAGSTTNDGRYNGPDRELTWHLPIHEASPSDGRLTSPAEPDEAATARGSFLPPADEWLNPAKWVTGLPGHTLTAGVMASVGNEEGASANDRPPEMSNEISGTHKHRRRADPVLEGKSPLACLVREVGQEAVNGQLHLLGPTAAKITGLAMQGYSADGIADSAGSTRSIVWATLKNSAAGIRAGLNAPAPIALPNVVDHVRADPGVATAPTASTDLHSLSDLLAWKPNSALTQVLASGTTDEQQATLNALIAGLSPDGDYAYSPLQQRIVRDFLTKKSQMSTAAELGMAEVVVGRMQKEIAAFLTFRIEGERTGGFASASFPKLLTSSSVNLILPEFAKQIGGQQFQQLQSELQPQQIELTNRVVEEGLDIPSIGHAIGLSPATVGRRLVTATQDMASRAGKSTASGADPSKLRIEKASLQGADAALTAVGEPLSAVESIEALAPTAATRTPGQFGNGAGLLAILSRNLLASRARYAPNSPISGAGEGGGEDE